MIEVNLIRIKRSLFADGCTDLARGMSCLRWSLVAGKSYEVSQCSRGNGMCPSCSPSAISPRGSGRANITRPETGEF